MALRILFLDDSEYRHKKMKPHLLHDEARTAQEAKNLLALTTYDAIFLDHDLGGEVFVSSEHPNCGMAVARYIVSEKVKTKLIVVHSLNSGGAGNIVSILGQAGYTVAQIPYITLVNVVEDLLKTLEKNDADPS